LHEDDWLALLERRADLAQAVLAPKVSLGQEEEDNLRAANVALQRADILKVIHVKEDFDAGQKLLQLVLDHRDSVLTSRPYVAVEEVPRHAFPEHQLGGLLGRHEPNRGDLGDAAGGDDGADKEDDESSADEHRHGDDDGRIVWPAQNELCFLL